MRPAHTMLARGAVTRVPCRSRSRDHSYPRVATPTPRAMFVSSESPRIWAAAPAHAPCLPRPRSHLYVRRARQAVRLASLNFEIMSICAAISLAAHPLVCRSCTRCPNRRRAMWISSSKSCVDAPVRCGSRWRDHAHMRRYPSSCLPGECRVCAPARVPCRSRSRDYVHWPRDF